MFRKLASNRHSRFYFSLAMAALAFILCFSKVARVGTFMVTWTSFAFTNILLSRYVMLSFHPKEVKAIASFEDRSSYFIFLLVIIAAFISLFAVIILLQTLPDSSKQGLSLHILLSLASVFGSWMLIHTLFTLRYAHLYYHVYYHVSIARVVDNAAFDFPNELHPDYLDFAYFSFVLGMTFQVSDVAIKSRKVRRLALIHSFPRFCV
jgi:uncharacterized membrane protein